MTPINNLFLRRPTNNIIRFKYRKPLLRNFEFFSFQPIIIDGVRKTLKLLFQKKKLVEILCGEKKKQIDSNQRLLLIYYMVSNFFFSLRLVVVVVYCCYIVCFVSFYGIRIIKKDFLFSLQIISQIYFWVYDILFRYLCFGDIQQQIRGISRP